MKNSTLKKNKKKEQEKIENILNNFSPMDLYIFKKETLDEFKYSLENEVDESYRNKLDLRLNYLSDALTKKVDEELNKIGI